MKATGMIRRIDELGRVVIPKIIRQACHIEEGDPLEIYTTPEGDIIFKKYNPMDNYEKEIKRLIELAKTLNIRLGIYHRDSLLMLGTDTEIPNTITIGNNYNQMTNTITFGSRVCPCYCIKDEDNEITIYIVMYSPEENAVSKGQVFALTKMLEKIIKNT